MTDRGRSRGSATQGDRSSLNVFAASCTPWPELVEARRVGPGRRRCVDVVERLVSASRAATLGSMLIDGQPAPPITLAYQDGTSVDVATLRGKWVLLDALHALAGQG